MNWNRAALATALGAATIIVAVLGAYQQPSGEPFSTAIRQVKPGLWVIPGYDGQVTGGNVAVRGTSEGVIIVDDRFGPAATEIVLESGDGGGLRSMATDCVDATSGEPSLFAQLGPRRRFSFFRG